MLELLTCQTHPDRVHTLPSSKECRVPDNDIFRRYVAKPWRRATECFHDHMDPEDVAPMLIRSAARSLSSSGGLPAFPVLFEVYWQACQELQTPAEALSALRLLQAEGFHNRNVKLAVRAVGRLIAAPPVLPKTPDECSQHVALAFLAELIDHNVLDPSVPEIENLRRFPTFEDRNARADDCRRAISMDGRLHGLATALRKDPSCTRMRLPKSDKPKATTEQLLSSSVG